MAILTVKGQSTFTLMPQLHVGDTLTYQCKATSTTIFDFISEENKEGSARKFMFIVKGTDDEGNFKVDYVMKDAKLNYNSKIVKDFSFLKTFIDFYENDMKEKPIHLIVSKDGRLLKEEDTSEIIDAMIDKALPEIKAWIEKMIKQKLPDDLAKEKMRDQIKDDFLTKFFVEIPDYFKYYGKPLLLGKSETVDSMTTTYAVARMDDNSVRLKVTVDMLNGKKEADNSTEITDLLIGSDEEDDEEETDDIDLGIKIMRYEDYSFLPNGVLKSLSIKTEVTSDDSGKSEKGIKESYELSLIQ